jgi:hypothetical protein
MNPYPMLDADSQVLAKKAMKRAKVLARWRELYEKPLYRKVGGSLFSLLVTGLFVWLGSRVLIGDFYYLTDNTTFVCNDEFCWQRGQGIVFKGNGQALTRYHCPKHQPNERAVAKRSRALLDTPNLLGTVLFSFTLLIWPWVAFSNFYCSFWAPPPPSESDLESLEG